MEKGKGSVVGSGKGLTILGCGKRDVVIVEIYQDEWMEKSV